jgi:radical SAM-linked protein
MEYSLGFHPKPRMSFCPALRLGWGSLGELLEVRLEDALAEADLVERLNRAAPEGLEFLSARGLEDADPGMSRLVKVADYAVLLPRGGPSEDGLRERMALLGAGAPLGIVRRRNGSDAHLLAEPGRILDLRLEGAREVFLRVRIDLAGSPRPDEVALFLSEGPAGEATTAPGAAGLLAAAPATVNRLALWALDSKGALVSPLNLELLRHRGSSLPPA